MSSLLPRLRELAFRVFLLSSATGLLGLLANTVLPTRIPWAHPWSRDTELRAQGAEVPLVSLEEAREIVEAGSHLVLDARTRVQFRKGHLPGAFSVPQTEAVTALGEVQMLMTKDQPILVYCAESGCDEGLLLCLLLRQQGYRKTALFLDGYRPWAAAGLDVEKGS
jgi:rhodanese-related sulfurtransferase